LAIECSVKKGWESIICRKQQQLRGGEILPKKKGAKNNENDVKLGGQENKRWERTVCTREAKKSGKQRGNGAGEKG